MVEDPSLGFGRPGACEKKKEGDGERRGVNGPRERWARRGSEGAGGRVGEGRRFRGRGCITQTSFIIMSNRGCINLSFLK